MVHENHATSRRNILPKITCWGLKLLLTAGPYRKPSALPFPAPIDEATAQAGCAHLTIATKRADSRMHRLDRRSKQPIPSANARATSSAALQHPDLMAQRDRFQQQLDAGPGFASSGHWECFAGRHPHERRLTARRSKAPMNSLGSSFEESHAKNRAAPVRRMLRGSGTFKIEGIRKRALAAVGEG